MSTKPRWADAYGPGVPLHLDYGDTTVLDLLEGSVARFGDRDAIDFLGRSTTYAQVGDQVSRVAEGLRRLGVGPGDRVALVMPNCPQNLVAFFAVLRLGATAVEHNPLYTAGELRPAFADHGAKVAVVWDKIAPVVAELRGSCALEQVVAVDLTAELPLLKRLALRLPVARARASREQLTGPAPGTVPWSSLRAAEPIDPAHPRPVAEDVALLLYTSGTTGSPKGVELRHRNLVANVTQGRAWVPGLAEGKETFLVPLPLFHAYGVTVSMLLGVSLAARLVLLPKPDTDLVMEAISRRVPDFLPAVPPLYARILDEAERRGISLQGIRFSLSGAMPLTAELIDRWEAATGGLLVEGYGLTETSPVIVGNPMTKGRRPGSIGVPFPDTEVRVVDREDLDREVPLGESGELLVRGPQVFSGYRGLPEETAEAFHDGWFRTGDVVTMSPDGYLTVVDRVKEIIITGGFNVYPSEVEAVIRTHGGVVDAAVVGILQPGGGEEVVAAVVQVEGVSLHADELREHARAGLTPYKVPRRVVFVDELPTNPMGKVLRREVVKVVTEEEPPTGA